MVHIPAKNKLIFTLILSTPIFSFLINSVYAESTIKNKVKINGVEYINEEVKSEGPNKTDIDVSIKNGEGTVKYNKNGNEKIVNVSSKSAVSAENDKDDSENENQTDDKKTDSKEDEIKKKPGGIIEMIRKTVDSILTKLANLFNN